MRIIKTDAEGLCFEVFHFDFDFVHFVVKNNQNIKLQFVTRTLLGEQHWIYHIYLKGKRSFAVVGWVTNVSQFPSNAQFSQGNGIGFKGKCKI